MLPARLAEVIRLQAMSAGRQNTDSTKRTLGIRRQIIFEPRQFFILFAFLAFFSGFLPFIVEKQFRERSCLIGRWLRDGTLNRPWLLQIGRASCRESVCQYV